ncbi:TetR/AcrR family transcriptional regulator [Paludisphaera rhizosphaerae]|uniref:TetR/AcrR family transcriptional regulator n=1 Tax=Paludisphaera rhizosphaerae TaxID=2711216 RepID=UPI0013ECEAA6|nr:TetR/AcrR family transcriptional regulator [Paludisphaera rhizosphaerae]
MRYPADHKAKTRARILDAAGRVFRRRGYHASGVDAVMAEAGLKPGGFYAHFDSKESLLAEAIDQAAAAMRARGVPIPDGPSGREWASAFVAGYLSPTHRDADDDGCPLAALASEVARAGDPVKQSFEAALLRMASRMSTDREAPDDRTLAVLALCLGGLGLSRAVFDETLALRILAACRTLATEALADGTPR